MRIAFASAAITLLWVLPCLSSKASAQVHTLPATIDCVAEAPYSEVGSSSIATGSGPGIGSYRETGANNNDRMCWLFQTDEDSKNDMVKVTVVYPSNATRQAEIYCISGGRLHWDHNALGSGYYTGIRNPPKNRLVTQTFYFHLPSKYAHKEKQFAIAIKNPAKAQTPPDLQPQLQPAAVVSIKVEDVNYTDDLPAQPVESLWPNRRRLGLWWEDAVLTSEFSEHVIAYDSRTYVSFPDAVDRQIKTCLRTHATNVCYPVVQYTGALYNASSQYMGDNPDRWMRAHPTDYDKTMAAAYSANGIGFYPTIRAWMLPSLESSGLLKSQAIVENNPSENYINAVTKDGEVRQYDPMLGYTNTFPVINCLHPSVYNATTDLIAEIADRMKDYSSFKGIMIINAESSIHGFGSLDVGYDDYTMHQFATDNGLSLPDYSGTDRFQLWRTWVHDHHWAAWQTWRKAQLYSHFSEWADIINAAKPGAKLVFSALAPRTDSEYNDGSIPWDEMAANPNIQIVRAAQVDGGVGEWFDPDGFSKDHTHGATAFYKYYEIGIPDGAPLLTLPTTWRSGYNYEHNWIATSPKPAGNEVNECLAKAMAKYDPLDQFQGGFHVGSLGQEERIIPFAKAFNTLPNIKFDDDDHCDNADVIFRTAVQDGKRYYYAVNNKSTTQIVNLTFTSNPNGLATYTRYGLGCDTDETITDNQTNTYHLPPYALVTWISNNLDPSGARESLVFYYKMDGNTIDSSGNANDGTIHGDSVTWTTGRTGSAINLAGPGDFIRVYDSPSLSVTGDITIAAWIKCDDWSNSCNIASKGGNSAYRFRVKDDGTLWLYINDGTNYKSYHSGVTIDHEWRHVAVSVNFSKEEIYFYVDGVLKNTMSTNGPVGINNTSADLLIGSYNDEGVENFVGTLDEVRIYNYSLTNEQIGRLCLNEDRLVYSSKLENDATDSSRYANDGTVHGSSSAWVAGHTGNAIALANSGDFVQIPDSPSLSVTGDITIAAWIKCDDWLNGCNIVSKGGNNAYRFRVKSDGTLWFYLNDGINYQPYHSGVVIDHEWRHVAVTANFSENEVQFYVDGISKKTMSITGPTGLHDASTDLFIGTFDDRGIENFIGNIDEVRIYSHCLTEGQIHYLYSQP